MFYNYRFDSVGKTIEILSKDPNETFFALKELINEKYVIPFDYSIVEFIKNDDNSPPVIKFYKIDKNITDIKETLIIKHIWIGEKVKFYVEDDKNNLLPTVYYFMEYVIKILKAMNFKLNSVFDLVLATLKAPDIDINGLNLGYCTDNPSKKYEKDDSYHVIWSKAGYFFVSTKNLELFLEEAFLKESKII